MNKQELIDKLKRHLTVMSEVKGSEYDKGYKYATKQHLVMIANLDEPEKPVVPQFVADFYESIKDDFEDNLYKLCIDFREQKLRADLNGWFSNDNNKPIETLVLMHKFGYEVEKEKLYTVEIPNPNRADVSLVLGLYNDGKVAIFIVFINNWKYEKRYKLTEAEIKQDFEWAWQFAKEVEND